MVCKSGMVMFFFCPSVKDGSAPSRIIVSVAKGRPGGHSGSSLILSRLPQTRNRNTGSLSSVTQRTRRCIGQLASFITGQMSNGFLGHVTILTESHSGNYAQLNPRMPSRRPLSDPQSFFEPFGHPTFRQRPRPEARPRPAGCEGSGKPLPQPQCSKLPSR